MIQNKDGVIIKLDTKSVLDFFQTNKKPLVLYGMGETGAFTLEALEKRGISVTAVADSSLQKQGTIIMGRKVYAMEEVVKKYPDAMVWITISDIKIRQSIVSLLKQHGIKNMVTFDIKTPMCGDYYIDMDTSLPFVLIGTNEAAKRLMQYLQEKGLEIRGYADQNPHQQKYMGYTVYNMEDVGKNMQNINIVVCDDRLWKDAVYYLHQNGVYENIYRYIVNTFGVFEIEKYEYIRVRVRPLLVRLLSAVNGMEQKMIDSDSVLQFQKINYRYMSALKESKNTYQESEFIPKLLQIEEMLQEIESGSIVKPYSDTFCMDLSQEDKDIFGFILFMFWVYTSCIQRDCVVKISQVSENIYEMAVCK